jgi:hypothetical protein
MVREYGMARKSKRRQKGNENRQALMPNKVELATHRLINVERKKRLLPLAYWDKHLYELAKAHSLKMADARSIFHSGRYALEGGENCYSGPNDALRIVRTWMRSEEGHREWLLHPSVRTAAVGISIRGKTAYVAWSFSSQPKATKKLKKKPAWWFSHVGRLFLILLGVAGLIDMARRILVLIIQQAKAIDAIVVILIEFAVSVGLMLVARRVK